MTKFGKDVFLEKLESPSIPDSFRTSGLLRRSLHNVLILEPHGGFPKTHLYYSKMAFRRPSGSPNRLCTSQKRSIESHAIFTWRSWYFDAPTHSLTPNRLPRHPRDSQGTFRGPPRNLPRTPKGSLQDPQEPPKAPKGVSEQPKDPSKPSQGHRKSPCVPGL